MRRAYVRVFIAERTRWALGGTASRPVLGAERERFQRELLFFRLLSLWSWEVAWGWLGLIRAAMSCFSSCPRGRRRVLMGFRACSAAFAHSRRMSHWIHWINLQRHSPVQNCEDRALKRNSGRTQWCDTVLELVLLNQIANTKNELVYHCFAQKSIPLKSSRVVSFSGRQIRLHCRAVNLKKERNCHSNNIGVLMNRIRTGTVKERLLKGRASVPRYLLGEVSTSPQVFVPVPPNWNTFYISI